MMVDPESKRAVMVEMKRVVVQMVTVSWPNEWAGEFNLEFTKKGMVFHEIFFSGPSGA